MRAPAALWALPPAAALLLSHLWVHHRQPTPYMDELYHVPQASLFCARLPSLRPPPYLPELSTPPGAYLLPTLLSPLFGCSLRPLRLHASLCVLLTLPLLASVAHSLLGRRAPLLADARAWRTAAALATHPPLLFGGALFYTDAPAAAALAAAWALALRGRHASAAAAGLFATSVRQTSAVWHAALALHGLYLTSLGVPPGRLRRILSAALPHLAAACVVFAALAWNGFSIAVGHREHHAVRPHWAMPAYFGAYASLFGLPLLPLGLPSVFRLAGRRPFSAGCALAGATAALMAGVRATGDRVHRFVLADNRHYSFYLYRRLLLPFPRLRDAIAATAAGALAVVCAPAGTLWWMRLREGRGLLRQGWARRLG